MGSVLTPKQVECIKWASIGKTAIDTGDIMGVTPHSVERRLKEACERLNVNNKTALVAKAIREGFIE
jgi:LuxR family quorum sensing-dependent transcriptional regulator